jgi:hypothetical protein
MEDAGMVTITLSPIAAFTASVGAPRVCAIEYPNGRGLDNQGRREEQLEILRAVLDAVRTMERPGEIRHLPFTWQGETRKNTSPDPPPPIARYLKTHPWDLPKLINRRLPRAAGER